MEDKFLSSDKKLHSMAFGCKPWKKTYIITHLQPKQAMPLKFTLLIKVSWMPGASAHINSLV